MGAVRSTAPPEDLGRRSCASHDLDRCAALRQQLQRVLLLGEEPRQVSPNRDHVHHGTKEPER